MSTFIKYCLGVISALLTVIIIGSVIIFIGNPFSSNNGNTEANEENEDITEELSAPNDTELSKLARGEMDFDVSDTPDGNEISERAFANDIHRMTHQKVVAEEKWGYKLITEETLNEMMDIAKDSNYEYKDFYIDVLGDWQEENFDNAVRVHNIIWNAKDGTVGEAQRLFSENEEEAYIEEHFTDNGKLKDKYKADGVE